MLRRLDAVNPINNPTAAGADNEQLLDAVQQQLEEANGLRDQIEAKQEELGKSRDYLIGIVQPLNELGEREVLQAEVDRILEELNALNTDLVNRQRELTPTRQAVDALANAVGRTLDADKSRKLDEAAE